MMPFKRIKAPKRYLLHTLLFAAGLLLTVMKGYAQVGIGGSTTVLRGNSYYYYATYNGLGSYPYSGSYYWSISGGYVTGQSGVTSKSGTVSGYAGDITINVTWNTASSAGSLYLSINLGSKTINITVVAPLNAGTISLSPPYINWGATATFTQTPASGGGTSPTYSYQWQKSTDAVSWTDISGATVVNYTTDTLQTSRYFRRKVTETQSYTTAYTNTATVNVYPQLTGSISASQNINYNTAPDTLRSAVSGGNGTYSYQWQSSLNATTWSNVSTSSKYKPGALTATTYYRLIVTSNSVSVTSNTVTITVYPPLTCSISSSQNINYNSAADPLTSSVGGGDGTYTYQWQSAPDNNTWTTVGSSDAFDPGVLTTTTYYRLITSSNGAGVTSNTVVVMVYPQLTCSISPASQTIDPGDPATTLSAAVSGGNGTYSYQWQSSPDNISWTNEATTSTCNPGALTSNRFYRLIVTSNNVKDTSNTATVNISITAELSITSTTPSGDGSVNVLSCTTGGGGSFSYTWYYSTNGGSSYQVIAGATGDTYTTGEVTATTMYYVAVVSGGNTANSNTVSITMPAAPTVTSDAASVCNGDTATFTASGGSGSYRWYNAAGAQLGTGTTYSTAVAGTYYAVSYSGFGISGHSNNITLVALNTPSVSSILGATVCVLGSSVQLANTLSGGSWSSSDNNTAKTDANGVVSGQAAGTATITYTATNVCGTSSAQLGITVVPFEDISLTLGNGIADPLITDTISLLQNTVRATEYRQDTAYSSAHSIKNVLALRVVEESGKYIPGSFSATAVLQVEYGHSSADIYQLDSVKLHVNYTKDEGSKYNALHYFAFSNAEFTRITVLRVEAPATVNGESFDTREVLQLTNSLAAMRYYKLADNKKPVLTYADPGASPVPDLLPVSWVLPAHTQNNGVQLEWAWLEDGMKDSYTVNGVFDTSLLFKASATRIDLPGAAAAGHYDIPLLYDGAGALYMRARAVNIMPAGSRSDGPWSAVSTYAFGGHNDSLNWQASTTFAEEGKRKTVIQYYDGSLRQRQTVTKDNTTGETVVAETFYDGQGRPAVQLLPAPGINNIIAYTRNLNRFNTPPDNTDPADYFDFTTAGSGNYATAPLDKSTGAAKYYSDQNPDYNTGYHKNIPAANGYAYTVTRYTPDATGRILRQSGAGDSLRMGSGHETRYFYGTPAQEELDALFGTEAGNYTHYFKNMVQDANGQMSVSYTDMHGRTVATALAGEAPAAMQALNIADTAQYKNQAGKLLTRNLLDKNSNILKGSSIESVNSILVPFKTNHTFHYQLDTQTLTLPKCGGGTVTYDCRFDLQISVTDESGDTEPVVYNYANIDHIYFNETLLLDAGSYSVRKSLTINRHALDSVMALYNTIGVGICKTQQQLIDSIYAADSTGCSIEPAALTGTGCMTALGGYATYLSNYAAGIGTTVGQLSAATLNDIRNQYIADSAFCVSLNANASHTLATIRKQMLADMVPYSGQYAAESGTGAMYNKYNIFSTNGGSAYTQPSYKYPRNQTLAADHYYGPFGNVDSTVLSASLSGMTKADFEAAFKDSWAISLLPYHPEYAKLKFAEDTLRSSYDFIDSVQSVTAPFPLVTYDPYFALSGTTADKDSLTRYSNTAWKEMNNYSMWQVAYGDAFGCKLIADANIRDACYNNMPKVQTSTGTNVSTGSGTVALTAAIQAQAWTMYKGFYRQVRDEMVNRYINIRPGKVDTADNQQLIDQGFRIWFPYSYVQAAKNNGWQSWYPQAGPGGSTGTVNLADSVSKYSGHCDSYIETWKAALLDCPALAGHPGKTAILNSITDKMLEVCKKGTDAANSYGASTVAPACSGSAYTSFEQVVYAVLDSAGIDTSLLCNPYGIAWPKPYGKNPQLTRQYIAAIDDCTCTWWSVLSNEIGLAGYDKYSLTSVNQYLQSRYQDTLTPALFNGLNACWNDYTYNCRDTIIIWEGHPEEYHPDTIPVCDHLPDFPLQSPQPLPAFLNCGFDSSSLQCFTCTGLRSLDSSFYDIFGKHPVFSGTLSDSAMALNDLFARYVNFKTGLEHSWMYYAEQLNNTGCPIGGISGTGAGLAICPGTQPLNDTAGFMRYAPTPCEAAHNRATEKAALLYNYVQQQLIAGFNAAYFNACLGATETFTVADTIKEYHYTLYYYDQAGNLVKTVPPKGVRPDYSSGFLNTVKAERNKLLSNQSWTETVPQHELVTRYNYNSLNQVVIQKTPDAGVSRFWYDRLGRLAVSRNAKQVSGNGYSYTYYDSLGRITEVGQLTNATAITNAIAKDKSSLQNWLDGVSNSRVQITQTIYDIEYGPINGVTLSQKNLRNRVSYTQVINSATDTYPASATYYTYDIHGNVDTLLQDFGNSSGIANAMNQSGNRFRKIVYNYDLISGKVNQVSYQPGEPDAYYHRYEYDAENRLTDVYTGRDSIMLDFFPEREAHYNYYKHGPLAQTILGQLQVQQQDYVYTLQGWLKAVNPDSTISGMVAKNVYGFVLNYYNNDYAGIGAGSPSSGIPSQLGSDNKPLFNGNISSMGVNIPKLGNSILYNYQYDQLNRLVTMDAWNSANNAWGSLTKGNDYKERFSYNPDGGILTLQRNGAGSTVIDNATWNYYDGTHRLAHINDPAGRTGFDAGNQSANNYTYSEIGEMTGDAERGLTNDWTIYGKLKTQTINGTTITYTYDAAGNRISKQLSNGYKEFYVRDASGNVMSIYRSSDATLNGGNLTQAEVQLYGSARLGSNKPDINVQAPVADNQLLSGGFRDGNFVTFTRGNKFFDLGDHRSNNLITISDRRQQVSGDNTAVDYYTADIITARDYSSFGSLLQGRQYGSTPRYTYNDKQLDIETGWQDYGMRPYLVDVPVFGSVDPLTKKYPHYTPYQFSGNMPIAAIDIDGLEPAKNPDDPSNQDNRNPTTTINTIFEQTGGSKNFEKNYKEYMKGKFDPSAKFFDLTNKDEFASDTKFENADKYNIWVNNSGVFYADDYKNYNTKDFANFLLGSLINGVGPENIVFPVNGSISSLLKNSGIVNDAMDSWYALNKMSPGLLFSSTSEFKGDVHSLPSLLSNGLTHPETFIGSASITIRSISSEEVMISVFNITSLTSGDLGKHFPWNSYPNSVVRDPSLPEGSPKNRYGNISQLYQFTLPIDFSRLTKK